MNEILKPHTVKTNKLRTRKDRNESMNASEEKKIPSQMTPVKDASVARQRRAQFRARQKGP